MIITCSKCTKRFMVEDKLIPEAGREVRCSMCSHVWRQFPDTAPLVKAPPFLTFPAQEFVETRPSPKKRSRWAKFMLILVLTLGIGAGIIGGREYMVQIWPRAERFFTLAGFPIETAGFGLSISQITPLSQPQEGVDMIVITGEVKNTSDKSRHLPPLKLKIVKGPEETEQIIDQWEHIIPISVLLPGESLHFETDPHPRPEGGERVVVGF